MRKNLRVAAMLLISLALFQQQLASDALAQGAAVSLSVSVALEGTLPEVPETFTIRMTADDPSYPSPPGSAGGVFDLAVEGAASASFPPIAFDRVGVYTYEIRQIAGADPDCTYDARKYQMTVFVVNEENGSGLEVTAVLYREDEPNKLDEARFLNVYATVAPTSAPSPTPTPAPTSSPGSTTPTGVQDRWVLYLVASAGLLIIGGAMIPILRRRTKDSSDGEDEE